jgi:hypothetical protein
MALAAAELPRAPIYGIATHPTSSGAVADFEIGWDEFARDTEWAHAMVVEAGLRRGDLVLFTTPNHENPWVTPIVRALRRVGASYATAETYGWDSRRFAMYLRRLPVTAVLGLGAETVEALTAEGSSTLATLLAEVRVVWTRADALARVQSLGVPAATYLPLGPALGLGLPGEAGGRVNGAEWTVEEDNGLLRVTNNRPRATSFDAVDTGVLGRVTPRGADFVVEPV